MLTTKFLTKQKKDMLYLGNSYSGYWIPSNLLDRSGTIWGVGLGRDSSFEYHLMQRGYNFIGFEPEKDCFNQSIKQFRETSALIENYGLWDKSGLFPYTGENISIVNIFDIPVESKEMLEIRSLWDVADEKSLRGNKEPRILKLNIEGAEREILKRLIIEPLEFEVIIFQAEFLFHIGFKRFKKKIGAYRELSEILEGFQALNWTIVDLSRHQITLIKSKYANQLNK
jgi:FkbM family methyltransferase